MHVELAVKAAHLRSGGQIQDLTVYPHMNACKVDGIEDLGKVFRIAVFPPAHFRLIWIVHPGDVGAKKVLSRKTLFVVGALAHAAIAQGKERFRQDLMLGIPGGFRQLPGVGVNGGFHSRRKCTKWLTDCPQGVVDQGFH